MKQASILFIFGFLALFLTSCDPDDLPEKTTSKAPEFLFLYEPTSSATYGSQSGFFSVTPKNGEAVVKRLNNSFPAAWTTYDVNEKGLVAYTVNGKVLPADAPKYSKLAYFKISNPENIKLVNPPQKPADWHWVIPDGRAFVLNDGKIITNLRLDPDYYGSDSRMYLGVYDTETEKWTISPNISGFILDQPEQGWDTEAGLIKGTHILSPDQTKLYITAQGYGVDGGSNHYDYEFLAYYDIKRNDFVRVFCGSHVKFGASNNSVFYKKESIMHAYDINAKTETMIGNLSGEFTGAGTRDEFIYTWRGSGLATYSRVGNSFEEKHVINTKTLTNQKYRGLGSQAFYINNEKEIVFSATTDFYTNYNSELVIYKTPIVTENADPELLLTLPKDFNAHFKLIK